MQGGVGETVQDPGGEVGPEREDKVPQGAPAFCGQLRDCQMGGSSQGQEEGEPSPGTERRQVGLTATTSWEGPEGPTGHGKQTWGLASALSLGPRAGDRPRKQREATTCSAVAELQGQVSGRRAETKHLPGGVKAGGGEGVGAATSQETKTRAPSFRGVWVLVGR